MPRKSRIDVPGALHHIIIRGIERKRIFQDNLDRSNFLDRLGSICTELNVICYAWALMPNHVHLLLRSGMAPISTVMRRLLTGYAVTYNHRHKRHGHLFQNRYKSILCQEDTYLLELARYIHLNPLRTGVVSDIESLDHYPYSGHSVIMGKRKNDWQEIGYILGHFGSVTSQARKRYRAYIQDGIARGRRADLTGGGLIRSLGGWSEASLRLGKGDRIKADERILGNGDFVEEVLRRSEERLERKYQLKARGIDLESLAGRVAVLFGIEPEKIYAPGKYKQRVDARSLFCYWAVRELDVRATDLAKKLRLSQPGVSISVKRGEKIAREKGIQFSLD